MFGREKLGLVRAKADARQLQIDSARAALQNALTLIRRPASHDLVIEGGLAVTPDGARELHVGVTNGKVAELSAAPLAGRERVNAARRVVLPGAVDAHVHFNDPGRADWEGWACGSRAAAVGGVTTVVDMPLNAHPPTIDRAAFGAKLAAARGVSRVDYALWGGLVDDNVAELRGLRGCGAVGFKAFMCDTGIEDFAFTPPGVLARGMREVAALDALLALHAEDAEMVRRRTEALRATGRLDRRAWLEAHALDQELLAIERALRLAAEAACRLHVVHVSLPEGVQAIGAARRAGQKVTLETCMHYLSLTDEDFLRIGPAAKCAPPLRDARRQGALWAQVLSGEIDLISSDHSPSPLEAKTRGENDIWAAWGGIQGVQFLLPLLLGEGVVKRGLKLEQVARLVSDAPARLAGLPGKGRLEVGADADLAIAALGEPWRIEARHLRTRHPHSPYLGRELHARIERVYLRGHLIAENGEAVGAPGGRFLRRGRGV